MVVGNNGVRKRTAKDWLQRDPTASAASPNHAPMRNPLPPGPPGERDAKRWGEKRFADEQGLSRGHGRGRGLTDMTPVLAAIPADQLEDEKRTKNKGSTDPGNDEGAGAGSVEMPPAARCTGRPLEQSC
ncbi:hypothetical protein AAFF_G00139740 [Aldrovandia affinis]|uniref:Uncharacterized protein n=1 Tax=Aldrovandia affinis TaxID=143900 RepID=A0AAD7TCA0_9TELE|nr:hypothetical protein AAFF_G00139740 [Aldrovandia affinis]